MKDNRQRLFEMMHRVSGMPLINENNIKHLTKEEFLQQLPDYDEDALNEIDFENVFSDASANCLNPAAIVKWLNEELERLRHNRNLRSEKNKIKNEPVDITKSKIEPKVTDIIMSQGNIEKLFDSTGDFNIDMFISNITKEPTSVFDHNKKMERSDIGRPQMTVNTGIPALVGVVYDMDESSPTFGNFFSITTCPGAGTCPVGCYARKAFYRMNDDKVMKLTRRLNLLMNNPQKYEEKILQELEKKILVDLPEGYQLVIRWNDAGDFFAKKYFDIARNVTETLLKRGYNVKSYAYTKRAEYVMALNNDKKFVVNFSTDASKSERDAIANWEDSKDVKQSHRVPAYKKEMKPFARKEGSREVKIPLFKKFFKTKGPHLVKDENDKPIFAMGGEEGLKNYIWDTYKDQFNIDRDSLRYTWELPFEDEGGRKYNVIVLSSGDSDIAAQREDVRMSFLLEH